MNQLSKFLVDSILMEEKEILPIVVYSGRFQPFHKGHYLVYMHLVSKFGKQNVYIGTSDVTDSSVSPFRFSEKKQIMTKLFGIPSSKIVKITNPYAPVEILKKYDKGYTAYVTVVGEKDDSRLTSKYFAPYKDGKKLKGYEDAGYVYSAPMQAGGLSGTKVRKGLSSGTADDKKKFFAKVYPKFDKDLFKLITGRLNESKGTKCNLLLEDLLNQIEYSLKPIDRKTLLMCGGAAGHMAHPFDVQMNLTFGDLKNIVSRALNGELKTTVEKLDGQALAVSWKNGRLIAARNKGHLKDAGKSAMDLNGVMAKFSGRGELTKAFSFAMKDLQTAVSGLSAAQKEKIFKNGKAFMNLEIVYPGTTNVIPYDHSMLVFHGTTEYDKEGNAIGSNSENARILAGMIKQINSHVQETFSISGPPITELPQTTSLSKLQPKYIKKIQKLQSEFGLGDKRGIADYHLSWWKDYIKKNTKNLKNLEINGLAKRWALDDKSFAISNITAGADKDWAQKIEKESKAKIYKDNVIKFEEIFLGVGADVMQFMQSALVANSNQSLRKINSELKSSIKSIKASGDPAKIEKLKFELKRLESIGGFEKLVPYEGIVFTFKGKLFKLTGTFAALNSLLGIMKY